MSFVGEVLQLEVPCDVHAPSRVRAALASVHVGGWSLEDGLLVASELVTNAVEHSGCAGAHRLNVEIGRRGNNLRISVHDPGLSGAAAEPVEGVNPGPGGRGLRIVELLSARWGSERPDGYRVWAELPVRVPGH
jgi:anti-sigma regulatory factor (Ser/Thr protein kinase)